MNGSELEDLCTEINGGDSIGTTLLTSLLNTAKSMVEELRPWMVLRATDTSKTVYTSGTWQTAIDLSTITRFNRFYESTSAPIKLFDGNNGIEPYYLRPFEDRLYLKDINNTCVYDDANQDLYLNGRPSFSGTLYINHIKNTPDIDLSSSSSVWSFPTYAHPLLAFMAVAIHKGGIDFDTVNERMAPENRATAATILKTLEMWDNQKQLSVISSRDPYGERGDYRSNAINIE